MMDDALLAPLQSALPVQAEPVDLADLSAGLIIVDEVNGFCTVGAGNLAPHAPDQRIASMVDRTDQVARAFRRSDRPVLAFLDTHEPGKAEPPYPPHCERGSGEEELVPTLQWLEADPDVTLIRKDCINGFIGAMEMAWAKGLHGASHNKLVDWVNTHRLQSVVTVGICTDICVMDLVLTMLSARNHGSMPTLRDIVVLEPACATYDLSEERRQRLGLPKTAAHPAGLTHHLGLYFMASRGARIASELSGV